jgi:hypothetical protein
VPANLASGRRNFSHTRIAAFPHPTGGSSYAASRAINRRAKSRIPGGAVLIECVSRGGSLRTGLGSPFVLRLAAATTRFFHPGECRANRPGLLTGGRRATRSPRDSVTAAPPAVVTYDVNEAEKPSGRAAGNGDDRFGPDSPRDRCRTGSRRGPHVPEHSGRGYCAKERITSVRWLLRSACQKSANRLGPPSPYHQIKQSPEHPTVHRTVRSIVDRRRLRRRFFPLSYPYSSCRRSFASSLR